MTLSIRIINIDHCSQTPSHLDQHTSLFSKQALSKVPLIRIFGTTALGQKACVYIHQVYPYFFIPYVAEDQDTEKAVHQFGLRLNQAIDLAQPYDRGQQHVAATVLVQATEFYGYHEQPGLFLKIYLMDPGKRQVALDLLQSGALGRSFQPYEAHLSYVLQFMIDHNLYGMDWLHLSHTSPRAKPDTYCALEVDAQAGAILNRSRLTQRTLGETAQVYLPSLATATPELPPPRPPPQHPPTAFEAVEALYTDPTREPATVDHQAMAKEKQSTDTAAWHRDATPESEALLDPLGSGDLAQWIQETERQESVRVTITYEAEAESESHPIQISSIPPDASALRQFRIQQLDGAHERPTQAPQPSAKDRWDQEIKMLRQMRRKRKAPIEDAWTVSVDIKTSPMFRHRRSPSGGPVTTVPVESPKPAGMPKDRLSTTVYRQQNQQATGSRPIAPAPPPASLTLVYTPPPPVLDARMLGQSQAVVVYPEPFYSKPSDRPRYPTVFQGKEFRWTTPCDASNRLLQAKGELSIRHWTPAQDPPSVNESRQWLETKARVKKPPTVETTQLDGPSFEGAFDFKYNARSKPKASPDHISFFSLELHVNTREELLPDPHQDPVQLIFYCLQSDDPQLVSNGSQEDYHVGLIALKALDVKKMGMTSRRTHIDYGQTELDLIKILIDKVRRYDPEMLVGYEIQNASWGYLIERAAVLGLSLVDALARVILPASDRIQRDEWGYKKASAYKIVGRHLLNVWRCLKNELALTSYTLENIAYHLLHHRLPHFSYATLSSWYTQGPSVLKHRLFQYYLKRVQINLDLLEASQVIYRAFESARIFGIDFFSVLTRGSQFKVESLMFRIGKPENFLMITPSRKQVAEQRSLECLPLVMEPLSKYYSSPMAVLDFQSLYPSIMIAYNYCYSTCLGRHGPSKRMGVLESLEIPKEQMERFKENKNISPNGVMFVTSNVRKGLLGKMLQELLETRVKVKKLMKDHKEDTALLRTLDAKQLTLKFIANVTYGYTSASYSGRMPSVDIGDSIVSTGRAILEKTIDLINTTEIWGAKVVYGDTDSVFVYFEGKSREEAFALSQTIADTITHLNPNPIRLKFEKIYHPAILLAKKRYVGFKYEHPDDTEPVYEAKGIETVRRDHTSATQKILEASLKILFRTQDASQLKEYLYKQWEKILSNRVSVKDFIIAKEVRMGTYASRSGPHGAIVAQANMMRDARAEPQYGERVPYVVVYKGPGTRLQDRVVRPEAVLNEDTLRLDAEYYIRKQIIAPISRIFNLMGIDIMAWYDTMPRSQKIALLRLGKHSNKPNVKKSKRIDHYYSRSHCLVCSQWTDQATLCASCLAEPDKTIYTLNTRQSLSQKKFRKLLIACQTCSGLSALDAMTVCKSDYADIPCDSLDCPIYFERLKAKKDVITTLEYHPEFW